MATKMIGSCVCGYPLAASHTGERVFCPNCRTMNEATTQARGVRISQGVSIPTWLFAGGIGFLLGVVAGPAILASTEGGAKYLERQVRERIR